MRRCHEFARRFSAAVIVLTIPWARSAALHAESVVADTQSGRQFVGEIDPRTTRESLAIRLGAPRMHLVRRIDWSRVTHLRVDGKEISPAELIARFDASQWPSGVSELPVPASDELPAPSEENQMSGRDRDAPSPASSPVVSMHCEASAGKWTPGAETDGVLVRLFPLDADGNLTPVQGTLEVDLIGQQGATQTRGEPFPRLARWAQNVVPDDFGPNGAVYRFPFQAWNPDIDLQLGSSGAVHARLSVPGQGVFDDTATMVRLRPFSTTRDRLQRFTGKRFFPEERTDRGVIE